MKAKIVAIFLLCMVAIAAQAAIYRILSTDLYVNGMPPNLTTAQKAKWLDQVNITETNTAIDANKYTPITTTNASKKVKELDKPVVVVPTCVAPQVLNVATNKCENPPAPTCKADEKLDTATNKCVARCVLPEVWNATTAKCETPYVPPVVTPSVISPPKVAVGCNGNGEMCTIPAGMTAKVWYGVHTKWTIKENVTGSIGCNATVMGDPKSGAYNRCFYVDNKLLAKNLDPQGKNLMPEVNKSLVPTGAKGFSTAMIKAAPVPPADKAGAFRISCEYSHMSNDDPIVYPGVPNATHHHTFFGNTEANAYSTNETLHNSGNSTCAGGILNRSGYWMPSLINTTTGAPAKPTFIVVYYKAADEKNGPYIKAPPAGLRMIAGNPKPLAVADADGGFMCQDQTQVMNPANWGKIWGANHIAQSCGGPNQMLRMIVSFPQCWDGKNLDSPDHKSHMAFACGDECENAQGIVTKSANSCPASHPIAIPSIAINADFFGLDANAKYRLASDNYSTDYPGGYSLHADWMNGWDEPTIQRMVKNCLNEPKNCGGPNLGDGWTLYGVNQD